MDATTGWDWNIAVFCQNEAARIGRCLTSIRQAAGNRRVLATLIANGTTDDSIAVATEAAQRCGLPLALYRVPTGDKSNAINRFYYDLRVPAKIYFSVDGYVIIGPKALQALADCLDANPHAPAVTGVCINGRTMKRATQETLERGGRLHGQLHAFRPEFIERMVSRNLRLPLGTYWGDGVLGSMAAHNLDAIGTPWDNKRIVGAADATYEIPELSPFRPADVQRHLKRRVRQMRGRLQNLAIKAVIYQHGFEGLPDYADTMVRDYLRDHAAPRVSFLERPFMARALRQIDRGRPFDPASLVPVLQAAAPQAPAL